MNGSIVLPADQVESAVEVLMAVERELRRDAHEQTDGGGRPSCLLGLAAEAMSAAQMLQSITDVASPIPSDARASRMRDLPGVYAGLVRATPGDSTADQIAAVAHVGGVLQGVAVRGYLL